ncbi:plant UBX domain-containing 10-like [Olea europaea subsp. europaea]|uniref:Plant UBX domain-containing 10-like n=1 Tax=Olea europaea subsp. europaea TaxID=158383 RepID=A0A8S0P926_OLEEU|nr:plant UBX domain-containing 10-like [Olea europaea subsp. europaea]
MSSTMRRNARSMGEAARNGFVRRMVNLPRSILGEFSRAMGQGIDLVTQGRRRNYYQSPNFPSQNPHYPIADPLDFHPQEPPMVQEEWAFLAKFEEQYGTLHPFFYACRLMEALKIAADEHKFLFMYIHSPEHPFTPPFCRETLCSEVVVQFLDANFVSWGGLSNGGEGLQMATTLRVSSFPFCAVVAPASGDSLAVLQQMEGPVSPAELVGILQRTIEEQGLAFGSDRGKEDEKKNADRRLREEQNAAYLAALKIDQKERLGSSSSGNKVPKHVDSSSKSNQDKPKQKIMEKQQSKVKEGNASGGKKAEVTQLLIRFPNGERREHSFLSTDKIQEIYRYVDSLGLPGVGNYRLISNFPRKVYGVDQIGMTLKDAGLHPKASLFLELL